MIVEFGSGEPLLEQRERLSELSVASCSVVRLEEFADLVKCEARATSGLDQLEARPFPA